MDCRPNPDVNAGAIALRARPLKRPLVPDTPNHLGTPSTRVPRLCAAYPDCKKGSFSREFNTLFLHCDRVLISLEEGVTRQVFVCHKEQFVGFHAPQDVLRFDDAAQIS